MSTLEIRGLKIEGNSDGVWHPIVKGVDLTLKRGEVLGLIGESGAGKSTIGLAAMGFARPGCRIVDIHEFLLEKGTRLEGVEGVRIEDGLVVVATRRPAAVLEQAVPQA